MHARLGSKLTLQPASRFGSHRIHRLGVRSVATTVMHPPTNIVLIGMPGSGKSTVGVVLAKQTSRDFVDTDVIIQALQRRSLQDIVDEEGYMVLRRIEEGVLLGLAVRNHVIATGGSAVYSDAAMRHLKSDGIVVFLDADLVTLESRVHDYGTRGLAKAPDQTFAELYEERFPLYAKHADIVVECEDLSHEEVSARIAGLLGDRSFRRGRRGRATIGDAGAEGQGS